jgi:formylglycine-generating enzyme
MLFRNRRLASRGALAVVGALLVAALAPSLPGCSGDEDTEGSTRLFIDTDLPTPEVASRLRIDLYRADGTWFDSRELDTATAGAFPASFDLAAPASGSTEIRVRLRVFPAGATRGYRGERFAEYDDVFAAPPAPVADESPRLLDANGADRTPETEPLPSLTVDRLVTLRADAGKKANVGVVLHGACAGTMAHLTDGTSCVATARERGPISAPSDALGPTHSNDLREPCPEPATGGEDADAICVPGGVFVLGDRLAPFIDDEDGFFLDMRTERLVQVRRFWMDRGEITVGRYRAAEAAGFKTTRYSPKDNPGPLSEDPTSATSCTYTDSEGDREGHPLNCLPWGSFQQYCAYAGGSLPTEAQWEYAATLAGGTAERRYPWGDEDPTCDRAIYARVGAVADAYCPGEPALAPAFAAEGDQTPLGLRDLAGGMAEFVLDGPADYTDPAWIAQPFVDPQVPNEVAPEDAIADDQRYGLRGGSWASPANILRSALRVRATATSPFYGARCVYPSAPQ